ncbi:MULTISPECIES: tRNA (adenosine(37)-N6)-threonylcarbamoyltransferase complex dimerization subunit type 1 TsaB [Agrobacterium]|jgi:tRNA threonylcarbamoyladenosine biosynthesis protein TsaB|uniref:tRNA (Adenosine(37)-N6)-threonylcarbamoyltransferase complex dimerization subunit type 1 TsaB n=1 Tax=Agrobacterium tumefaciens TaxID=358 RepID=A0AAP9E067_AGRTU|nr:tRNA (adenosine(37)-N6)-threonylcarbamoyltransferase complex dimerization subunit type 1 TsaB [Agrobacterium tumefaciens]NSZ56481.1 tRNA (adenosine(37)-N6)-threonylcarbamoyltransferase complex dimerization subunit type 1 TsaB [Agrobacterium tumefaciens]QDY92691.1 tRNA (adenosine(37)-N6)-threonylcarbamoyltransferase complex dimerization subunit type 1 TsaB [Agrobacterium tumefaciens]UXS47720.1 tRNA (adenosine(37)-N6)-threonylcarbamoyltransferase complex dimerization subunit type 1 TsaB [Agroba
MIVLALDTSGVDCSACIYDSISDRVLGEVCETIGKGHAERLMAVIDGALEQAQLSLRNVERIAVTIGPGSFTGIRVGVAAARGFALSLGIEAMGVTTLETLALHHLLENPDRPVAVGLDAKRGETYLQTFSADGSPLRDAGLLSLEDARMVIDSFDGAVIGSAAPLFVGAETGSGPDHFPIASVARAAARKPAGQPKPAPLYLRGPDARPQTGFALARQGVA